MIANRYLRNYAHNLQYNGNNINRKVHSFVIISHDGNYVLILPPDTYHTTINTLISTTKSNEYSALANNYAAISIASNVLY